MKNEKENEAKEVLRKLFVIVQNNLHLINTMKQSPEETEVEERTKRIERAICS